MDILSLIQTGRNQLNNYYSWPAVVVIQVVWPGLYVLQWGKRFVYADGEKLKQIMEDILHKVLDQLLAKTILWK